MLNTLNVARSGLSAAQVQVENVMNNIANENTIGYKKRTVDIKEADHADSRVTGRGVIVEGVDRVTNMYVYDNLITHQSKATQYEELSNMLASIEATFFETEDSGLSNDLNNYFQSIEDLRANPSNEIYRSNLINSGQILVDDLKNIYSNIEAQEKVINNRLDDNIDEINGLLKDIGIVNKQIIDSLEVPNALYDERDLLESRISEYLGIELDRENGYSMDIGGLTAVRYDTNIHDIRVVTDKIAQKDVYADLNNVSTLVDTDNSDGKEWDTGDTLTYYFNDELPIEVKAGELMDESALNYDVDGDGSISGNVTIDKTNLVRALVAKINTDPTLSVYVQAYNGQYNVDDNNLVQEKLPLNIDHYLMIESKIPGIEGKFDSKIIVDDNDVVNSAGEQVSNLTLKNTIKSDEAHDDIHLQIFDSELVIDSGRVKSMIDNIDTTSDENKFTKYKTMLDDFAKALSDFTDSYIEKGDLQYTSGREASLLDYERDKIESINLFEGTSVNNLEFKRSVVGNLSQNDLDYLATMQWNEDIKIDPNGETTSFTKYYERLRVEVSADKENVDYMNETQSAVTKSLQLNYDKLVKVNKDDELINLIKFQSAYEANAKLITIVDEMLATILGMKR